jgi:hypothetical protein
VSNGNHVTSRPERLTYPISSESHTKPGLRERLRRTGIRINPEMEFRAEYRMKIGTVVL